MTNIFTNYWYLIYFLLVIFAYYISNFICKKCNLFEIKNLKKIYLSGGIFFFILIIIIYIFFVLKIDKSIILISDQNINIFLIFISFLFLLLGIFDDKYNISPNKKILLQILILFLFFFFNKNLLIHEIRFNNLNIQLNYYLALLFTIFCLLCLINAFNYIDGINGIAISFYLYCSVFLLIKSKDIFIILLIFPSLFFLLQNYKEKIFLGNSGSLLLPFVLGIQTIYMHNHYKINANDITLLFFVPGADFIYLFIIRLLKYKNPFRADLNHLHHLVENFVKKNYFSIICYNMILFFPIALNLILEINFIITIILLFFLYYSLRVFLRP